MARCEPTTHTTRAGASFRIRSIEPGDSEEQARFLPAAAATTDMILTCADEFASRTLDDHRTYNSSALADPGVLLIAAIVLDDAGNEAGRFAGSLSCRAHDRRRSRHAAGIGMFVDEPFRGQGIGDAMLRIAIGWARAHPFIEKLWLEVAHVNEPALRLYNRHGFTREGARTGQLRVGLPNDPSRSISGCVRTLDEIQMGLWLCEPGAKIDGMDR